MITLKEFMDLSIDEKKIFLDGLTPEEKSIINSNWKEEYNSAIRNGLFHKEQGNVHSHGSLPEMRTLQEH